MRKQMKKRAANGEERSKSSTKMRSSTKKQPNEERMVLYKLIKVLRVIHLFSKCISLAAFISLYMYV